MLVLFFIHVFVEKVCCQNAQNQSHVMIVKANQTAIHNDVRWEQCYGISNHYDVRSYHMVEKHEPAPFLVLSVNPLFDTLRYCD